MEMTNDALTPSESALLIVLMAEAREVSNPELKERYNIDLTGESRRKLNELRYVASHKVGRAFVHQLDDQGWVRVHEELNFDSPRARALGAALAALHGNLRDRVLPRLDQSFGEMFSRADDVTVQEEKGDLEERIREAYASLAPEPGAWVNLARLRPLFGDVDRPQLDEALRHLNRAPDVNIVPESNQKTLTDNDIDAAVRIGGQDKHLLAIGV
jgi:hypothetical protein